MNNIFNFRSHLKKGKKKGNIQSQTPSSRITNYYFLYNLPAPHIFIKNCACVTYITKILKIATVILI